MSEASHLNPGGPEEPRPEFTVDGTARYNGVNAEGVAIVAGTMLAGAAAGTVVAIKFEGMRINPPHVGGNFDELKGEQATNGVPAHEEADLQQFATIGGSTVLGLLAGGVAAYVRAKHRGGGQPSQPSEYMGPDY